MNLQETIWPGFEQAANKLAEKVTDVVAGLGTPFSDLQWRCFIDDDVALVSVTDRRDSALTEAVKFKLPEPVDPRMERTARAFFARTMRNQVGKDLHLNV